MKRECCATVIGVLLVLGVLAGNSMIIVGSSWTISMAGSVLNAYCADASDVILAILVMACINWVLPPILFVISSNLIDRYHVHKTSSTVFLSVIAVLGLFVATVILGAAVIGLTGNAVANDWERNSYPAQASEEAMKHAFDDQYCSAQRTNACHLSTAANAIGMFAPDADLTDLNVLLGDVWALCDGSNELASDVSVMCAQCERSGDADHLKSVRAWSSDKCAPTISVLKWCGAYLTDNSTTMAVEQAPYVQCRSEFVSSLGYNLLILGIGGVLASAPIAVLAFGCLVAGMMWSYRACSTKAALLKERVTEFYANVHSRRAGRKVNQTLESKLAHDTVYIDLQ